MLSESEASLLQSLMDDPRRCFVPQHDMTATYHSRSSVGAACGRAAPVTASMFAILHQRHHASQL